MFDPDREVGVAGVVKNGNGKLTVVIFTCCLFIPIGRKRNDRPCGRG
jgi:hypothetical protein